MSFRYPIGARILMEDVRGTCDACGWAFYIPVTVGIVQGYRDDGACVALYERPFTCGGCGRTMVSVSGQTKMREEIAKLN